MKTLLVEDNDGCRLVILEALKGMSETVCVDKLGDALAVLDDSFDLVWLDLGLPDSKPETTVAQIPMFRSIAPQSALLVASGYGEKLRESALHAGADAYAGKDELGGFNRYLVAALILQTAMRALARGADASVILRRVTEVILSQAHPAPAETQP